jgi:hypothetical protein
MKFSTHTSNLSIAPNTFQAMRDVGERLSAPLSYRLGPSEQLIPIGEYALKETGLPSIEDLLRNPSRIPSFLEDSERPEF